jgi:hypothetical protein
MAALVPVLGSTSGDASLLIHPHMGLAARAIECLPFFSWLPVCVSACHYIRCLLDTGSQIHLYPWDNPLLSSLSHRYC